MWDDINHDISRARESNEELTLAEADFEDREESVRRVFAEGRGK